MNETRELEILKEPNAHEMKKTIIIAVLLLSNFIFSQEYILLDSLKTEFKINKYTLETKDLYNIDKEIEVFNVFISKNDILLISVLPDLDQKVTTGFDLQSSNWMVIDSASFKNKIFSNNKIRNLVFNWKAENKPENKTLSYKLIKKIDGNYYVTKLCLTEFFTVSDLKLPFITSFGTINIAEKKVTIKEMRKSFKKQLPNEGFIMDVRENNNIRNIDNLFVFRNYLSKELKISGLKAYQFWTFEGWWGHDGYNEYRGIDRFVYVPEKGIVGGSYDFYFRVKPKISSNKYFTVSNEILWHNIINEKVMVAQELSN
jgi:hypothetical protein